MARQQRWEGEEVGAVLSWLNQVPAAAHEVDTASGLCCPRGTEHALFTEEGFVHIGTHLCVTAPPPAQPLPLGHCSRQSSGLQGDRTQEGRWQIHGAPTRPTASGHPKVKYPPILCILNPPSPPPAGSCLLSPPLLVSSVTSLPLFLVPHLHLGTQRAHTTSFPPGPSSQLAGNRDLLFLLSFFPATALLGEGRKARSCGNTHPAGAFMKPSSPEVPAQGRMPRRGRLCTWACRSCWAARAALGPLPPKPSPQLRLSHIYFRGGSVCLCFPTQGLRMCISTRCCHQRLLSHANGTLCRSRAPPSASDVPHFPLITCFRGSGTCSR